MSQWTVPLTPTDVPEFCCGAILGIGDRDEVSQLKLKLDKMKEPEKVIDLIKRKYESTAYLGDFALSQDPLSMTGLIQLHSSLQARLLAAFRGT